MSFFEEMILRDSVEIKTTPEKIFNFIISIVDDETYKAWHADDHVSFKWLKGEPWAEGSILFAEEYIHGKIHKFKSEVTQNIPNKKIQYSPISPLLKMFFPKNEFLIESKGDTCLFIASVTYRVGWIGKKLFSNAIDKSLASVKKHIKEEGENLKKILETGEGLL